jgi:hypothetical protein
MAVERGFMFSFIMMGDTAMDNETLKFWSTFEKETGEKVEALSEGIWYRVPDSNIGHEGILILTDKTFRFKFIPKTPIPAYMGLSVSPELEDETEFTVARRDIVSVNLPKRSFFSWLIRSAFPRSSVVVCDNNGEKTYIFSAMSNDIMVALGKAWPAYARPTVR